MFTVNIRFVVLFQSVLKYITQTQEVCVCVYVCVYSITCTKTSSNSVQNYANKGQCGVTKWSLNQKK